MSNTKENIVIHGEMDMNEALQYVGKLRKEHPDKEFKSFEFTVDGEYVNVDYTYDFKAFERIRRITGYLVGTLDRFNNAKRKEVEQRVKHPIGSSNDTEVLKEICSE